MIAPGKVNPRNFKVTKLIYNDGEFAIAWGEWEDGTMRLGMRWNGDPSNAQDMGYPKVFGNPCWFVLPEDLTRNIFAAIMTSSACLVDMVSFALCSRYSEILSSINMRLIYLKYYKIGSISAGSINGSIWSGTSGLKIVGSIQSTGGYSQDDFEKDLRRMAEILGQFPKGTFKCIIFTGGGDLILPDWFKEYCQNLGIEIKIIENPEQCEDLFKIEEIKSSKE